MKSLTAILLSIVLFSCQKKQCWTCSVGDSEPHGQDIYRRYDMPNPICDMTEREIRRYESDVKSANSFTYTDSLGNHINVHGRFDLVECR